VGRAEAAGLLAPSGEQGTLSATFVDAVGNVHDRAACRVVFTPMGGVAPGRVWGQLACPAGDGCPVTVELRFENCAQR